MDGFGNVTDRTIRTREYDSLSPAEEGETITRTVTTFAPTPAEVDAWLIGLPRAVEVTSSAGCANGTDCIRGTQRRTTSFEYEPLTNLLRKATRAPELEGTGSSFFQVTELGRDAYGNVTSTITRDADGQTRESIIVFDLRGQFPIAVQQIGEGKIHHTQLRYDDRFGLLAVRADPNGIDETWSYDELGVERHHLGPVGERTTEYGGADLYDSELGQKIPAAFTMTRQQTGGSRIIEEYNSFGQPVRRVTSGLRGEPVFQEFL